MTHPAAMNELLPQYAAGDLEPEQRRAVEEHLPGCDTCQADLALWRAVSDAVSAQSAVVSPPAGLAERVLRAGPAAPAAGPAAPARRLLTLLRSQVPLVQREIWPASALVIGIGLIAALLAGQAAVLRIIAPLVAAGCISLIFGQDNDPAYELTLSTPTSPRQILLARLVLVFGYNFALGFAATLALLAVLPGQGLLLEVLLSWLAPMTFLSAAALALSLWIGASNAITACYLAWLAQLFAGPLPSTRAGLNLPAPVLSTLAGYTGFWQASGLLLALGALLFAAALASVGKGERGLQPTA